MKLDKSKPFGEIHGVSPGYRYEQDGHCFDSEGNLVGEPKAPKGEAAAKGKGAKPADAKAPKGEDDGQVDAQLAG